jgi:hypothetical protein
VSQHAGLSAERWARFTPAQRILQIAVELQRGESSLSPERMDSLRLGYERVLRLVDLTVQVDPRRGLRRELLRWRELIAALYLRAEPDAGAHRACLEVLLQLDPEAKRQLSRPDP